VAEQGLYAGLFNCKVCNPSITLVLRKVSNCFQSDFLSATPWAGRGCYPFYGQPEEAWCWPRQVGLLELQGECTVQLGPSPGPHGPTKLALGSLRATLGRTLGCHSPGPVLLQALLRCLLLPLLLLAGAEAWLAESALLPHWSSPDH
jgi:hypothetical protein